MDSSIIAAISAILGTTVGGLSTFATTFLNQRYAMRRDILAKDVANREQLYSEFLKEVGNLYFDSVNRTLDDTSQQPSLITMYSLVGRIRMISSEAVLTSAEKVAEDIVSLTSALQRPFRNSNNPGRPPIRGTSLRKHVEQSGKACWDAYSSSRSKPRIRPLPEQLRRLATKGPLARVLFQTMLERTSPLIRPSCSRFFISASISGMINGAKSAIREPR